MIIKKCSDVITRENTHVLRRADIRANSLENKWGAHATITMGHIFLYTYRSAFSLSPWYKRSTCKFARQGMLSCHPCDTVCGSISTNYCTRYDALHRKVRYTAQLAAAEMLTSEPFLVPKKAYPLQAAAHFCELQEATTEERQGERWSSHLVYIVDVYYKY